MLEDSDNTQSIDIFTGTIWEVRLVQSMLADAEIESFVRDSSLGTFLLDPVKSTNCKLMILEKDQKLAKQIVDSYYKNLKKEGE
ncbi:MAG: hypothetical protein PHX13_12390 [Thiovulaceae bacterium]|nr:hypothetical protein [Sulfurimonadaceae bacterium]